MKISTQQQQRQQQQQASQSTTTTNQEDNRPSIGSNKVVKIQQLITELSKATLRSLYIEVAIYKRKLSRDIDQLYLQPEPIGHSSSSVPHSTKDQQPKVDITPTRPRSFSTTTNTTFTSKNQSQAKRINTSIDDDDKERSWVEILNDLSQYIPYLSDDVFGELLRLCSICLLAYALPYSTGMDYYYMTNHQQQTETFSVEDYITQMSLEERLEKVVVHSLQSNSYGNNDHNTITDPDVDIALDELLQNISKILAQRPVHSHQVDLLHVMAIIIHPCHTVPLSATLSKPLYHPNMSTIHSPSYQKALRLMENPIGIQFHVHYGHRRQMIQLIQQCMCIPQDNVVDHIPLYTGALPHLLSSIRQFCYYTSVSRQDSMDALFTLVSLQVQCHYTNVDCEDDYSIIQSEFDSIVHRMIEEQEHHPGSWNDSTTDVNILDRGDETVDMTTTSTKSDIFSVNTSYGTILSELVARICQIRSSARTKFLPYITQTIMELIEWQIDSWVVDPCDDGEPEVTKQVRYSPSLLTQLLIAAKQTFCYLPNEKSQKDAIKVRNDDDPYYMMIRSSIALLRHPDHNIVRASVQLLIQAFTIDNYKKMDSIMLLLCTTVISPAIQKNKAMLLVLPLVTAVSSTSYSVATFIVNFILGDKDTSLGSRIGDYWTKRGISDEEACMWMSAIVENCPFAASDYSSKLLQMVEDNDLSMHNRCQIGKSILFSRLTHYFLNKTDTDVSSIVSNLLQSSDKNYWVQYKIATNAIISGHFNLSFKVFRKILADGSVMDTPQFLWISVLERLATAETQLSRVVDSKSGHGGALNIPGACSQLYSAVSYMETLMKSCKFWKGRGSFQLRFLLLRLDFLDLVTIVRHLTREMRLTGKYPTKTTRSHWHILNVERSFHILADRYCDLYRHYGLSFKHNQSIIALALLQSLSSFMAAAIRACFRDIFVTNKLRRLTSSYIQCDVSVTHPMMTLTRRLDQLILQPMISSDSIEERFRAAATLELIDGILQVPFPIPQDFFTPREAPIVDVLISADPNPVFQSYDETLSLIETIPKLGFSFIVSGHLSKQFCWSAKDPIRKIQIRYLLRYTCPLEVEDDENDTLNERSPDDSELRRTQYETRDFQVPFEPVISREGYFFCNVECPPLIDEGNYELKVSLSCLDKQGNDWAIFPCDRTSLISTVRVSRSRSII